MLKLWIITANPNPEPEVVFLELTLQKLAEIACKMSKGRCGLTWAEAHSNQALGLASAARS